MLDLNRIPEAVRHEGGISRRLFVGYMAALAAVPLLGERSARGQTTQRVSFPSDPFTLGVASGDPEATSVMLWTRLAPDPTRPDGGMPAGAPVAVTWEVAEDAGMRRVVGRGTAIADGALGHSVHAEATGLSPDRWYWYRFRAGDAESPIGRTRTLPAASALPGQLRLAFASCQHYEAGHYTAYQHMAQDELDLVFHVGDYIYEGKHAKVESVRMHSPTEANGALMTLTDYRLRYAQYKSDAHLKATHARCPWFVTPDDHEVSNNYANDIDGKKGLTPAEFLVRRAAAYQAYYEMMPLRPRSLPKGPDMQLYRGASFGRLAEVSILDTRQFRSDQPNGDGQKPLNAAATSEHQTIMGARQKRWLKERLVASPGTWNVIAQQVMMGMVRHHPAGHPEEDTYSMDSWTGYTHERIETVQFLKDRNIRNPVVLTGDVHANFVNELRVDDRQDDAPVVAAEFVGTSITSGGDGVDQPKSNPKLLADNAVIKYHNAERGYVRCTVTPTLWRSDYVTVAKVTEPDQPVQTRASFVVEAGRAGIQKA